MQAIDKHLADGGLQPSQRPLMVGRLFWEAFKWGGQMIPPNSLTDSPGFEGDVLTAKANRWYEHVFADKLKMEMAYGHAPFKLGNAVWKARFGLIFGKVSLFIDRSLGSRGENPEHSNAPASYNVLCAVEGLQQGMADRLKDSELKEYFDFYISSLQGLQWRDELPNIDLLCTARSDYDQSTEDVMSQRYAQARWGAQQSVEKTLKGLLFIGGSNFPKGGPNGHNLNHLGMLLSDQHGIAINATTLELASCSTKVRYGEEPSTEEHALLANHAVLEVLKDLRTSPKTADLLARYNSRSE
ncbi:HEPN domain-containing protein [Castellaniella ginsengisoli]|uniref:HEPN domain-containing protein n=1 Tax=Castellaniella ginsengisoli TaxID=546114 RepID=A0AB39E1S0_9BURK